MKLLRRIYYWLVPTYVRTDIIVLSKQDASMLMKVDPEWKFVKEEAVMSTTMVALEKRKRITE